MHPVEIIYSVYPVSLIKETNRFDLVLAKSEGIGSFPFFRFLLDGEMKDVEKPVPNNPSAKPGVDRFNKAKLVDELGLQLTTKKSEVGAFYLPGYPFTTDDGLKIEFEYMMYLLTSWSSGLLRQQE